MLIVHTKHH